MSAVPYREFDAFLERLHCLLQTAQVLKGHAPPVVTLQLPQTPHHTAPTIHTTEPADRKALRLIRRTLPSPNLSCI